MTDINLFFPFGKWRALLVEGRQTAGLICLTDPPQCLVDQTPLFGASGEETSPNLIQVAGRIQAQVVIGLKSLLLAACHLRTPLSFWKLPRVSLAKKKEKKMLLRLEKGLSSKKYKIGKRKHF